jgi:hypothetical protein
LASPAIAAALIVKGKRAADVDRRDNVTDVVVGESREYPKLRALGHQSEATAMAWLDSIPWWTVVIGIVTLGLAPFSPEPHIWEKLKMLAAGTLSKPLDIFDLVYHAIPWLLGAMKLARAALVPTN